jgi:hypothetical protein
VGILPLIRVTSCRKLYFLGLRIHHGGVCAIAVGLALVGVWHDRHDFPWPLRDPFVD